MILDFNNLIYLPSHQQPLIFRIFFMPLVWAFYLVIAIRNGLYDLGILKSKHLPGITVSIGNIAVGGTGKTPTVIEIAHYLLQHGQRPAILTRGYKSSLKPNQSLTLLDGKVLPHGESLKHFHADEAMLQSRTLKTVPVIVGAKRYVAATRYLAHAQQAPTHWLLDDGFQTRGIHRDIDLVLFDAKNPWGNGCVMPLGFLREPLRSVRRATAILFTRTASPYPMQAQRDYLANLSSAPQFCLKAVSNEFQFLKNSSKNVDDLRKGRVLVAAAIARPAVFLESLAANGITAVAEMFLPDHERFAAEAIGPRVQQVDFVVTTAKDYWRQPGLFDNLPKPVAILNFKMILDTQMLHEIFNKNLNK